jgi:hypothetical protein
MTTMRPLLAALLLLPSLPCAAQALDCVYAARSTKGGELASHAKCAEARDGKVTVLRAHLAQMSFGTQGLESVLIGRQHYYVKPDGSTLPVLTYDNWADDFAEGLVRARVDGRIAYYDATFRQVIAPKYDFGWPFAGGRAQVCVGCSVAAPDDDGHSVVTGGDWGYIDKAGILLAPLQPAPR